jgi:hypothetical protein
VPGAQKQKHVTVKSAGHFLQEDASAELVSIIHSFIEQNQLAKAGAVQTRSKL